MKFDIKKTSGYHATKKPQILERPGYRCLCINGAGDPNGDDFSVDIQAMYACAYGLKMGYKKSGIKAENFDDYVVPPLQGYWIINERAQKLGTWTKADLVYRLEIVIPEFVPDAFIQRPWQQRKRQRLTSSALIKSVSEQLHRQKFATSYMSDHTMTSRIVLIRCMLSLMLMERFEQVRHIERFI